MNTRDDLIAARKMMDTPETFGAANGNWRKVIYASTGAWPRFNAAVKAMERNQVRGTGFKCTMDQFDRAIAGEPE